MANGGFGDDRLGPVEAGPEDEYGFGDYEHALPDIYGAEQSGIPDLTPEDFSEFRWTNGAGEGEDAFPSKPEEIFSHPELPGWADRREPGLWLDFTPGVDVPRVASTIPHPLICTPPFPMPGTGGRLTIVEDEPAPGAKSDAELWAQPIAWHEPGEAGHVDWVLKETGGISVPPFIDWETMSVEDYHAWSAKNAPLPGMQPEGDRLFLVSHGVEHYVPPAPNSRFAAGWKPRWAIEAERRGLAEMEARNAGGGVKAVEAKSFRERQDGCTEERRAVFLKELARTGCVSDAARAAGVSATSFRRTAKRMPAFATAWKRALRMAQKKIDYVAYDRAVRGARVPVIHQGEIKGWYRKPSDSVLRTLYLQGDNGGQGRDKLGRFTGKNKAGDMRGGSGSGGGHGVAGHPSIDPPISFEEWDEGLRFDRGGRHVTREMENYHNAALLRDMMIRSRRHAQFGHTSMIILKGGNYIFAPNLGLAFRIIRAPELDDHRQRPEGEDLSAFYARQWEEMWHDAQRTARGIAPPTRKMA